MPEKRKPLTDRGLVSLWIIACMLVAILCALSEQWAYKHHLLTEDLTTGLIFYLVAGLSACFLVGVAQFLLLRKRMAISGWWILTYIIGYGLIGFGLLQYVVGRLVIHVIPNDLWKGLPSMTQYHVDYFLVGLSTGFGVGLLQWLLLRKHLDKAVQWFGICLLSGGISGLVIVLEVDAWGLSSLIAAQGLLSGIVLYQWLRRPSEGASGHVS
jgi:hypothetical protein